MTRPYVQRARAEAAHQTRRQVLDAARSTLLEATRLDFSVGDVAMAAGVARSTIYATFGTRAGLLSAVADDTLQHAGLGEVIAAYQRADAVEAIEGSLLANCRMYAADHRLFARLLVLAEVDADAASPIARSQRDRTIAMQELAGRLADQGRLRHGADVTRAAQVLSVLTSFWTFDDLHVTWGLDAAAVADVLIGIARAGFVRDAPGG